MMWGNKALQSQINELKDKVDRLSAELTSRTSVIVYEPREPRELMYHYGHVSYPRITHTDALRLIESHLGLKFTREESTPERWTLRPASKKK
jgi:hypothetical protein